MRSDKAPLVERAYEPSLERQVAALLALLAQDRLVNVAERPPAEAAAAASDAGIGRVDPQIVAGEPAGVGLHRGRGGKRRWWRKPLEHDPAPGEPMDPAGDHLRGEGDAP